MNRKRVIFHIGAHKTGTTYLQSLFSQHYQELNNAGIDYPFPETSEVIKTGATVGNVVRIMFVERVINNAYATKSDNLAPFIKLWNEKCADKLLEIAQQSNYDTILFSAEGISLLEEEQLKSLHKKFTEHFDVEFVFFVRDAFDYIYSAWRQVIKAYYSKLSFDEYVSMKCAKKLNKLGLFYTPDILIKNDISCKIINYDTYRKDLANAFFEHAGIAAKFEFANKKQISTLHNRSLSPSESELQLLVNNEYQNTQFPAFFRKELLKRGNHSPQIKDYYNQKLDQSIIDSFHPILEKINTVIVGDKLRHSSKNLSDTPLVIEPEDVKVLIDSIKLIESYKSRQIPLISRIKHFLRTIRLKHVPCDFDPQAYLELNSDVAISGIDPYTHYSQTGYLEGRPYRYY